MIRLPPRSTLMDTLVPSTPLFRSARTPAGGAADTSGRPRRRGRLRVGGLGGRLPGPARVLPRAAGQHLHLLGTARLLDGAADAGPVGRARTRSEEHTSELQSLMRISYAVFCLKKKTNTNLLM